MGTPQSPDADATAHRIAAVRQQFASLTSTHTTRDRLVSMTMRADGSLSALSVKPQALQRMSVDDVCRRVMSLSVQAAADLQQQRDHLAAHLGA